MNKKVLDYHVDLLEDSDNPYQYSDYANPLDKQDLALLEKEQDVFSK